MLVLIIGMAALMLLPGSALAKKKHKKPKGLGPVVTVTAAGNTTTVAGQVSSATATCPTGTQALGGGFSLPVGAGDGFLSIRESFRATPSDWKVSAVNIGGTGAVTAYANCRRTALQVTDTTGAATVPGAAFAAGTATAVCPSGEKLVGGGFQTLSGPASSDWTLVEENLSRGAGAWTASAVNNSGVQNAVTAHAYCMSGIRTPTLVSATNSLGVGLYGSSSSTTPACPRPKKPKKGKKKPKKPRQLLAAGGFSAPPPSPAAVTPFFTDSRIGSGGWLATAVNANASVGPLSVTSQGVCV
jgi:hypothetical protein